MQHTPTTGCVVAVWTLALVPAPGSGATGRQLARLFSYLTQYAQLRSCNSVASAYLSVYGVCLVVSGVFPPRGLVRSLLKALPRRGKAFWESKQGC